MSSCKQMLLSLQSRIKSAVIIESEASRLRPVRKCGSLSVSRGERRKAVHLDGRISVIRSQERDFGIYPIRCGLISFFLLTGPFHNLLTENV